MITHEGAILDFICKMDTEMIDTFLDMPTYQDLPKEKFIDLLDIAFGKFKTAGDTRLVRLSGVCQGECGNTGCNGYSFIGNKSGMQMPMVILTKDNRVTDIFDCFGFKYTQQVRRAKQVHVNSLFD
jgi:hypothetical protein